MLRIELMFAKLTATVRDQLVGGDEICWTVCLSIYGALADERYSGGEIAESGA